MTNRILEHYKSWKKYSNKLLSEDVQEAEMNLKNSEAKLEAAQQQKQAAELSLKLAQQEVSVNKKLFDQQKQFDSTQSNVEIPSAMTSTTGTTGTSMEEADNMSVGGRADGAVGKQPVSVPEELTELELEEACGKHKGLEEGGRTCQLEIDYEEADEAEACNECSYCRTGKLLTEAKYKGRTVTLNKPSRGDVKKFKVFVRDSKTGNVKKVNFGDPNMTIKKNNPKRRKSFRARHRCENPGPKTKARYWSCRKW
jgi:hypothetical protein